MRKRARRDKGWVYFIRSGEDGPLKIGWTVDPQKRLEQLQTGSFVRLFILGTIEGSAGGESAFHRRWANYRIRGEWFEPAPEILEFVEVHRHRGFIEADIDDLDDDYWDWLYDRLEIGYGPRWHASAE